MNGSDSNRSFGFTDELIFGRFQCSGLSWCVSRISYSVFVQKMVESHVSGGTTRINLRIGEVGKEDGEREVPTLIS